jgi:hypothetical protein
MADRTIAKTVKLSLYAAFFVRPALARLRQRRVDNFRQVAHGQRPIRKASRHRRGNLVRPMLARPVVPEEIESERLTVVLKLFRARIRDACKPSHRHTHCEICRSANDVEIWVGSGLPQMVLGLNADDNGRAIASRSSIGVASKNLIQHCVVRIKIENVNRSQIRRGIIHPCAAWTAKG